MQHMNVNLIPSCGAPTKALKTLALFARVRSGALPFLPPLHSSEHRN
jgi:hypothetical protein